MPRFSVRWMAMSSLELVIPLVMNIANQSILPIELEPLPAI